MELNAGSEPELTQKHQTILTTELLKDLNAQNLRSLGSALGLSYAHVKRLPNPLDDMVEAWLSGEDNVVDKGKDTRSWNGLIGALEQCHMGGTAKRVRNHVASLKKEQCHMEGTTDEVRKRVASLNRGEEQCHHSGGRADKNIASFESEKLERKPISKPKSSHVEKKAGWGTCVGLCIVVVVAIAIGGGYMFKEYVNRPALGNPSNGVPGPSDSVKKEALKTENRASKAGERTERVKAVITPFEDRKPDLSSLEHLKGPHSDVRIIRDSGEYRKLGICLLKLPNAAELNDMERDCLGKTYCIKSSIFDKWLHGQGEKPVTWKTLIYVLEECMQLVELAKDVKLIIASIQQKTPDDRSADETLARASSTATPTSTHSEPTSGQSGDTPQLTSKDHSTISHLLNDLNLDKLRCLGGALGLLDSNLQKMRDLLPDMVSAWLIGEDNVTNMDGVGDTRSREGLIQGLLKCNMKGTADKVRKSLE